MSLWGHLGTVCLLDDLIPSGSAQHPGRLLHPPTLLGASVSFLQALQRLRDAFNGILKVPAMSKRRCSQAESAAGPRRCRSVAQT